MYLDIFICIVLLWAVISGWRNGFVKEAFSTVGMIVGLVLAGVAYLYFGEDFLAIKGSETNMVLSIGAFILLWICLPLFFGLIANILTKAIEGLRLGIVNSLLGVGFSVLKFVLLLSCVLNMMAKLNIADQKIMGDSVLLAPATAVLPFIDEQVGVTDSLENYKGAFKDKVKEAAVDQIMGEEDTVWVEFKNHRNNSGEE
jgi:uncharacterized membrane protein required for colicin V production